MSKKRKALIWCLSILLTVATIFTAFAVYLSIYYKADDDAMEAFYASPTIKIEESKKFTAFIPQGEVKTGFIFYPGGKVDYKAYYPLMQTLADLGVFTAVAKMPFNLAIFDTDAAKKIQDAYPEITDWYIGGHSLGGAMASSHVSKASDSFKGLILLGAYSTKDISDSRIAVLSIYGSNDEVMNREKYESNRSNLPSNFTELVIDGGCHAYFGVYGEQKGDGEPTLSNEEQIYATANHIISFISLLEK